MYACAEGNEALVKTLIEHHALLDTQVQFTQCYTTNDLNWEELRLKQGLPWGLPLTIDPYFSLNNHVCNNARILFTCRTCALVHQTTRALFPLYYFHYTECFSCKLEFIIDVMKHDIFVWFSLSLLRYLTTSKFIHWLIWTSCPGPHCLLQLWKVTCTCAR